MPNTNAFATNKTYILFQKINVMTDFDLKTCVIIIKQNAAGHGHEMRSHPSLLASPFPFTPSLLLTPLFPLPFPFFLFPSSPYKLLLQFPLQKIILYHHVIHIKPRGANNNYLFVYLSFYISIFLSFYLSFSLSLSLSLTLSLSLSLFHLSVLMQSIKET